ncbi:hypothetical protein [Luteolibacter luteus]|uniref:Uncharacterized protein n=1 Tax=Luteolibacter luteus TaxID=2728835 RepID=A0A858RFR6_9BACT|nr:hypothetical protein [Luteolibacter luteus]QJE95404.1 hypothetical protein HHL09_06285 [Luteolibacter luteus]
MKILLPLLLAAISTASAFDQAAFGAKLNGWQRDGSAHYSLDGIRYRTLRPLESTDENGNQVILVTVIHQANSWAEVPFDLEVVLAPDGSAQSFRITGTPRGQKVDTGVISRPAAPEAPAEAEGASSPAASPFHPVAEMKKMLFEAFDSQAARAAEAKDNRKRDLLARIYGPEPIDATALAAGLRYNLDLILRLPTEPGK